MPTAASANVLSLEKQISESVAPALFSMKFISLLSNPKTSDIPNQNSLIHHGIFLFGSFLGYIIKLTLCVVYFNL